METDRLENFYVGIDWATEAHAVCVLDRSGARLGQFPVPNTPEGLAGLVTRLLEQCGGNRDRLSAGIEVPHGPVVDALLDAGFSVFSINPKQADRFRDRHSPAGAKDDRRDAWVLANALRTDPKAFHRIDPDQPAVVELREWSRIDQELGRDLLAQANRLSAQMLRVAPHWLKLCPAANEPWFWALLEIAPTPGAALELRLSQVKRVLKAHRIRRLSAEDVLAVLRSSPPGTPVGVLTAVAAHVRVLLPQLRLLHGERRRAETELARCLEACRPVFPAEADGPNGVDIVLSVPGIGVRVAACLFGEAGRYLLKRDRQGFRSISGTGPITKSSGKSRLVIMRRACNFRVRDTCYHWARIAVQREPRSKEHYAVLRAKGHGHARALRGITDRAVDRLFTMLEHGETYDPNRGRVLSGHKAA
jgi:transposase